MIQSSSENFHVIFILETVKLLYLLYTCTYVLCNKTWIYFYLSLKHVVQSKWFLSWNQINTMGHAHGYTWTGPNEMGKHANRYTNVILLFITEIVWNIL